MKVNVQYAEAHLADLASAVDNGEEVEITRPDKPALRLVVSAAAEVPSPKGPRILGALRSKIDMPKLDDWETETVWTEPAIPRSQIFGYAKGKMHLSEDWDFPETNAEIAELFENSKLFPETSGQ